VDAAGRVVTLAETVIPGRGREILPPAHLRRYYYRRFDPEAFRRAAAGARAELLSRGLEPGHRLLDVGSGIGNLAVGLMDYLHGGYDGLEVHREAVEWCQSAISGAAPSFRFHRADVASRAYNPHGRVQPSEYRFPFPDSTFDVVFLGSVFTHLLPDAVAQYLREVSRVLVPDGLCVASYFLLDEESRRGVDAGRSFLSFGVEHVSGLCRLQDAAVPEAAVALDETFVRDVHAKASLDIVELRRGQWSQGTADDQDVVAARARKAPR
jgi:SAM-dependent methyltransferase